MSAAGTRSLLLCTFMAFAPYGAADDTGSQLYERHCLGCHAAGAGHPGTMRLKEVRGAQAAVLTERDDLTAEYVKIIVRTGLQEMPPMRPTEITDRQLDALAAFLTAVP